MHTAPVSLFLTLSLLLTGCSTVGQVVAPSPTPEATVQPTPEPTPEPTPIPTPTVATLAVCGDVMSHESILKDAWNGEKYDYARIMAGARPYVESADFAVANLETTLSESKYTGYPRFRSPDQLAYDLKDMGFDLMLTANNHCLDNGNAGLMRTLDVLDQVGLAHVGTSRSQEEQDNNIVVADVGGISVAFLGYTYGTNGLPMAKDAPYAVNLFNKDYLTSLSDLDEERLIADLGKARATGADLVAVMIHWGVEYRTKQNSYQERIADLLIANGADLVLGGHSHVPQPIEVRTATAPDGSRRQGFVSYSLGNFISSQNKENTNVTAVITVELTKDHATGKSAVTAWEYAPMFMSRKKSGPEQFALLDAVATGSQLAIDTCLKVLGEQRVEL